MSDTCKCACKTIAAGFCPLSDAAALDKPAHHHLPSTDQQDDDDVDNDNLPLPNPATDQQDDDDDDNIPLPNPQDDEGDLPHVPVISTKNPASDTCRLKSINDEFEMAISQEDDQSGQHLRSAVDNDNNNNEQNEDPPKRDSDNPLGAPYTRREYTYAISIGILLSFNAGYVNGSCLSGLVAPSVGKVGLFSTGTITSTALTLAEGDVEDFGFLFSMTLCFFLGSFIAGLMTPNAKPFRIEQTYGPTFLLGGIFLTVASALAAMEEHEKVVFYLAAATNGIQNGISSIYSKNLIRSTGLTGNVTDIGVFFGQFLRGNRKNTWKLIVLVFLLLSFWLGGLISFYATTKFMTFSLLFNAGLFLLIGGSVVAFITLELDISLGAAMFGNWHWKRAMNQLNTAYLDSSACVGRGGSMTLEEHLGFIFDQVDLDNSGSIDVNELHLALEKAGIKISKRETARLMKRADENGDGTLSKDEWLIMALACQSCYTTTRTLVTGRQSRDSRSRLFE